MADAVDPISQAHRARKEGNLPLARELYVNGARILRDQNDILGYAHAIRHLADIHLDEGCLAEAKPLYEEAVEIYRSSPSTKLLDLANTVRPYALLIEQQGDFDLARKLWEEARSLYDSIRIEAGVSECTAHITRLQQA